MSACRPCVAAWGADTVAAVGHCDRHGPAVHTLARLLASVIQQVPEPTDEQIGWHMDDATEVAENWPADTVVQLEDLGEFSDDRRHFLINGERWASPDPNAEGYNTIEPMAPCPHLDGEPCEDCYDTGWIQAGLADDLRREAAS